MHLRLGGPSTDSTPGHQIRSVLRSDCVQELTASREAHFGDIEKESTRKTKALVDLEAVVHIGVVDEPFPADGGAWLFEVNAHDDEEIILRRVGVRPQKFGVF